jgi:hypothetical protein
MLQFNSMTTDSHGIVGSIGVSSLEYRVNHTSGQVAKLSGPCAKSLAAYRASRVCSSWSGLPSDPIDATAGLDSGWLFAKFEAIV